MFPHAHVHKYKNMTIFIHTTDNKTNFSAHSSLLFVLPKTQHIGHLLVKVQVKEFMTVYGENHESCLGRKGQARAM